MYFIDGYNGIADLKYRVASDPNIIAEFANFANNLGFGWCGGTQTPWVGQGFDVSIVDSDQYLAAAHYSASDPYHDGYMASTRLQMTFSDFQIRIDPSTLTYATPAVITQLAPLASASVKAINKQASGVLTPTSSFNYALSNTVSHTTEFSFTEGVSVSIKANAQIPFFGGGEVTTEVSFSATQGWSDTTTTTKSMEQTISATTGVQPRTSVVLTLMILDTKSDIAYTGTAEVAFNVTLSGFLQWGGNARDDHPKDRPQVKYRFGTIGGKTPSSHVPGGTTGQNGDDNLSALEHIAAMYNNRAIPKYSIWDWAWVEQKAPGYMKFFAQTPNEGCMNPIGVHLAGKFSDVAGTQAYIDTSDATPLPPQTDSDTDSGVDGWVNDAEHDPPNSPQEHSAPTFVVLR